MTFRYDYEALCAAMAFLDAAVSAVEDLPADEHYRWSEQMSVIRNGMNDERLAWLRPFGDQTFHVVDIARPTPQAKDPANDLETDH